MRRFRQTLKSLIPPSVRIRLRELQRNGSDRMSGQWKQLVPYSVLTSATQSSFREQFKVQQIIPKNSYFEDRKNNLVIAIERIENIAIAPNQIFSFWHLVGQPTEKKGYRNGRAIINNQLQPNIGGGICQLTGLLNILILKAGLIPLERHPHSVDIYTESTRFAPLGSDATVVYGYKDFRFKNCLSVPFCFQFQLSDNQITALLCSPEPIEEFEVEFKIAEMTPDHKIVETLRFPQNCDRVDLICSNLYPTLKIN